jgi:hypothetical protein
VIWSRVLKIILLLDLLATLIFAIFAAVFYNMYLDVSYISTRIEYQSYATLSFFFGLAAIFMWTRKWFASMVFTLNILFMWTSHVLKAISPPFNYQFLLQLSSLSSLVHLDGQTMADLIALGLTVMILISVDKRYAEQGTEIAALRAIQVTCLCLIPLGVEIFLFDRQEFNLHVSHLQQDTGLLLWFTNADLLYSLVFALGITSCLSIWLRRRHLLLVAYHILA